MVAQPDRYPEKNIRTFDYRIGGGLLGNPVDVDQIVEQSGKQPEDFLTPEALARYKAMKAAEEARGIPQSEEGSEAL